MNLDKDSVLNLLRSGTADQRRDFVKSLPPSGFKDAALGLVGSDNPTAVVLAISPMAQKYCFGGDPACGAVLASALHDRAQEISETIPDHGLILSTLSGLASNHVKALALLGRSEEVLEVAGGYIEHYESLGDTDNTPSIKVLRIEALLNLGRVDEAAEALEDASIFSHPAASIEANRLKGWVDTYRKGITDLPSAGDAAPQALGSQSLLDMLKGAIDVGMGGAGGEELKKHVDRLDPSNRLDPSDPDQHEQLRDVLRQAEQYFTGGGSGSELTVRQTIREASSVFMRGTPARDVIERSLADLSGALKWARENGISDLENDALWGIYLCQSRLNRPSEAADAVIALRGSLETIRAGIRDPFERGGVFSPYPHLFNVLCEQLQRAGRADDLLEAIESSKGRAIADRITAQTGAAVADSAIYDCVARLPDLCRRQRFHYLTYFVDEESVYAAFVSRAGEIRSIGPVEISKQTLRQAAILVDPKDWDQLEPTGTGARTPNVSEHLAPLVAWFEDLVAQGVVEQDDHVCYSSDDDFHNVPLHYIRYRDGLLIDLLSLSRVHSAFHLDHLLAGEADKPPASFAGFVVPMKQDLDKSDDGQMVADMDAPLRWLQDHELKGDAARLEDATLDSLMRVPLEHRIVHFSTHGWFPSKRGNPFHDSYLLMADETGLPDRARVVKEATGGRLSPRQILDTGLSFTGSHVSMMACVSGLAKEGVAGDTLGLDWALIQAGASSLLSSHWKVSAACTARYFESFYENWLAKGRSRATAARDTMLELLQDDRSPSALQKWAGFSLTGDFR